MNWQRWLTGVLAVLSLGMGSALAYEELAGDCCQAGAKCCSPGAPCCAAHPHTD